VRRKLYDVLDTFAWWVVLFGLNMVMTPAVLFFYVMADRRRERKEAAARA